MRVIWSFLLVLCLVTVRVQIAAQQDVCPPWFIPDNRSTTGCSCQSSFTEVMCGVEFPLLHFGFCMTYNSTTESTEYGPCPYVTHYNASSLNDIFVKLPDNVSLLNEFMCGPLNREG